MTQAETLKEQETSQQQASTGGPTGPRNQKRKNLRRAKIIKNIIITLVVFAILGGLTVASYFVFFKPKPVYYATSFVEILPEGMKTTVDGWGQARSVNSLEIKVPVDGTVLESYISESMMVNEGDVLCVLDQVTVDKEIERIQKIIDQLNKDIIAEQDKITKTQKDMQEVNKKQYDMQKAAMLYFPFSGKVRDVVKQNIGDKVTVGEQLATLYDDSTMILRQYFSYGYESDIKVGMTAEVSIPASMAIVSGKVSSIEKIRNIQPDGTITFEVVIKIDNPGALVKDMTATATMKSASGETILPSATGKLDYIKEQTLVSGSAGPIVTYNLHDYYEYKEGDLAVELKFEPDESAVKGYQELIKSYEATITAKNEEIITNQALIKDQEDIIPKLTVRAPMTGTVMYAACEVGKKMTKGGTICNVAEMQEMLLDGTIEQIYFSQMSVGMAVDVKFQGPNGESVVQGVVQTISLEAKNDYGWVTYPCVISIDNSTAGILPGFGLSFSAVIDYDPAPLVVPITAVKNTDKGECVFVKLEEKPANAIELGEGIVPPGFYAIPVVCGMSTYDKIQIKEGVTEGMEVFIGEVDTDPSASPSESEEPGGVIAYRG